MRKKRYTKLVQEGDYVAEVELALIESGEGWSPYLSLDDAYKLDDVRDALRHGDLQRAARQARLYKLTPIAYSSSVFCP
ncbi:MAG: hypothetical protein ABSD38_36005 [Syntrophorhabdales bacterium]